MAQIYSLAERVLIWLGLEENQSHLALKVIRRLAQNLEVDYERHKFRPNSAADASAMGREMVMCFDCCYGADTNGAIEHFFGRAWFSRLWVWQEVQRAREAVL